MKKCARCRKEYDGYWHNNKRCYTLESGLWTALHLNIFMRHPNTMELCERTSFAGVIQTGFDKNGKRVTYELSERNTRLPNGLKLREIAKMKNNGEQTIIVTSHTKKSAVLLAHRMFNRWRQENFFQYMKQNFALDEISGYGVEQDDPERLVTNPKKQPYYK